MSKKSFCNDVTSYRYKKDFASVDIFDTKVDSNSPYKIFRSVFMQCIYKAPVSDRELSGNCDEPLLFKLLVAAPDNLIGFASAYPHNRL